MGHAFHTSSFAPTLANLKLFEPSRFQPVDVRYQKVGKSTYAYTSIGHGPRDLVLLPGSSFGGRYLLPLAHEFAPDEYTVHVAERGGCRREPLGDWGEPSGGPHITTCVEDAEELLEFIRTLREKGIITGPPLLFAHSYAAMGAEAAMLLDPAAWRGVILADQSPDMFKTFGTSQQKTSQDKVGLPEQYVRDGWHYSLEFPKVGSDNAEDFRGLRVIDWWESGNALRRLREGRRNLTLPPLMVVGRDPWSPTEIVGMYENAMSTWPDTAQWWHEGRVQSALDYHCDLIECSGASHWFWFDVTIHGRQESLRIPLKHILVPEATVFTETVSWPLTTETTGGFVLEIQFHPLYRRMWAPASQILPAVRTELGDLALEALNKGGMVRLNEVENHLLARLMGVENLRDFPSTLGGARRGLIPYIAGRMCEARDGVVAYDEDTLQTLGAAWNVRRGKPYDLHRVYEKGHDLYERMRASDAPHWSLLHIDWDETGPPLFATSAGADHGIVRAGRYDPLRTFEPWRADLPRITEVSYPRQRGAIDTRRNRR